MDSAEAKKTSKSGFFLNNNNEILKAIPRRGAAFVNPPQQELLIKHSTSVHSSEQLFPFSVEGKMSREFRIQAALEESESSESRSATVSKPLADAAYLFSTAFTCIIMLAAKHPNIPKNYLNLTTKCLESITDEVGHCPPNIRGILKDIKMRKETVDTPKEEEANTEGE